MKKDINLLQSQEKTESRSPMDMTMIHQSQIPPNVIKQRHLDASLTTIKLGLSTNRPTTGDEVRAYFATDTGILSIWNNSTWLTVTLT